MKKIIFLLFITTILSSCVSQGDYQLVVNDNNELSKKNEELEAELEELKFGVPALISDGKRFYEAKEFSKARNKFELLLEKHSDLPESIEAKGYLKNIDEEELWHNSISTDDIYFVKKYINKYPGGKYISKAKIRKEELKIINMKRAYNEASNENSSYAWEKFLEDYPDHIEANSIRNKIIRLEVEEIMRNANTGKMPSFNQYEYSSSSSSSVEITNNTGCTLTVRYSGKSVLKINIPEGESRTVYVTSGSYNLVASACGSDYASTENLHGSYNSSFYIETRRW